MERIWVTGNAGAGKTSLAAALSAALGLPAYGLDSVVWRERWRKAPADEVRARVAELTSGPRWVVDGVHPDGMRAADAVVFLDLPRRVVALRLARRNVPYLFRSRPGLPARCPELLVVPRLARLVARFPRHTRPRILAAVERDRQVFVHVTTRAAQRRLRRRLAAAAGDAGRTREVLREFGSRGAG